MSNKLLKTGVNEGGRPKDQRHSVCEGFVTFYRPYLSTHPLQCYYLSLFHLDQDFVLIRTLCLLKIKPFMS